MTAPSTAGVALRERFGFAATTGSGSGVAITGFFRGRRVDFSSGAESAIALAAPSSSPATPRAGLRRRAGLVSFGFSAVADRLGGGGSTAGGIACPRVAIAREGSGGAVAPVGCAAPSAVTSK
ncbi:MAG: hypothetical protein WAK11_10370, partial [Candidatus Cybelea sp.]